MSFFEDSPSALLYRSLRKPERKRLDNDVSQSLCVGSLLDVGEISPSARPRSHHIAVAMQQSHRKSCGNRLQSIESLRCSDPT